MSDLPFSLGLGVLVFAIHVIAMAFEGQLSRKRVGLALLVAGAFALFVYLNERFEIGSGPLYVAAGALLMVEGARRVVRPGALPATEETDPSRYLAAPPSQRTRVSGIAIILAAAAAMLFGAYRLLEALPGTP